MENSDIPTETTEEPKKSSSGNGLIITLILLLQLGMIGYYAYEHHYKPRFIENNSFVTKVEGVSDEQLNAITSFMEELANEIDGMRESLLELDQRITLLHENNVSNVSDDVMARIDAIEQSLANTQEQSLSDERISDVLAIVEEVETLRDNVESSGAARWKTIQLLTSFERLEHQILRYEPYQAALYAFNLASESLQDQESWVAALNAYQHEGIPSPDTLRVQFESGRQAVLNAPDDETATDDAIDTLTRNLSKLIEVRKVGPQHSGNDAESVLARAFYAFEQREIEVLKQELQLLPDNSQRYFEEFLEELEQQQRILNLLPEMRAAIEATVQLETAEKPTTPPADEQPKTVEE